MGISLRWAVSLVAVLVAGSSRGFDDIRVGAPGSFAGNPNGESVSAAAVGSDASNLASATGGAGSAPTGTGGDASATAGTSFAGTGASAAQAMARGGDCYPAYFSMTGYRGGNASSHAEGSSLTASSLTIGSKATGGFGSTGNRAAGGNGGDATVSAFGNLQSGGPLVVTAEAASGSGSDTREYVVPAGLPGNVMFGQVRGVSAGDATVVARGSGGHGGSFLLFANGPYFQSGAGGCSVNLNNVVDGSAAGTLTLIQEATGGNAGVTARGNSVALPGLGTSVLERVVSSGTSVLDLRTRGQGGSGSFLSGSGAIYSSSAGALGGATSLARNDSGRALASAVGIGGLSCSVPYGPDPGSRGGPGSAYASATGLTLPPGLGSVAEATATGATGGSSSDSRGAPGGRAEATALAQTEGAGATSATALATAGALAPGVTISQWFSNELADASAHAQGIATGAAPLTVTAQATGGTGPVSSDNPGGKATATATGSTGGPASILAQADAGQSGPAVAAGQATATGTAGGGGSLTARASANRHVDAIRSATSALAIATTVPSSATVASAQAVMLLAPAAPPSPLPDAFATLSAAPAAAAVDAALGGQLGSAARFDTAKTAHLLFLGTVGARTPVGATGPITGSLQLSADINPGVLPADERQNLLLALVHPVVTGGGPETLRLRVRRAGVTLHDATLVGAAAARAYFTDHVLDLGPIGSSGSAQVDVLLEVTTAQSGAGFSATLFLGNGTATGVTSVDQWRSAYFGPGATNSGAAADDANPTGDGYSNLLKYALGWTPLQAYPAGAGVVLDTTTGRLRLTVERSASTAGIALSVEGTDDLAPPTTWSTQGLTIEQNTATRLQVSDDVPLAPGSRRMLRLRVTRR